MFNFINRLFKKGQTSLTVGGGNYVAGMDPVQFAEQYAKLNQQWGPAGISLALAIPSAYNSIDTVSNEVAICAKHSYVETHKGREISNHPVEYLFNGEWNESGVNSIDGLQAGALDYLLKGNFIALIDWSPQRINLTNLDPDMMDISWEYDERGHITDVYYVYNNNGNVIAIPRANIFHVKNVATSPGLWGVNPLKELCNSFRTSHIVAGYTSRYFEHGQHQSRYISYPNWFDDEEADKFAKQVVDLKNGLNTPGQWVVLQGGMTAGSLQLNNDEASLIDIKNYSDKQIRTIFGCDFYDSTEAIIQERKLAVYNKFFKKVEAEALIKLYTPEERKTHYFEFDRTDLVVMDQEKRFNMIIAAMNNNLLTDCEGRLEINRCKPQYAEGNFLHPANLIDPDEPKPQQQPPESQPNLDHKKPEVKEQNTIAEIRGEAVERWKLGVVANNYDCTTEIDSILEDVSDKDKVLDQVQNLDVELKAVLPEQRLEIIRKWKVKE